MFDDMFELYIIFVNISFDPLHVLCNFCIINSVPARERSFRGIKQIIKLQ